MRLVQKLLPFMLLILLASALVAQSTPVAASGANDGAAPGDRIAQLQQQIADAKGSADNAWMLVSAALVL
ncbi:MAG: ammonia channel protein, partial [Candidatus Korobacteraceae bacterium]